LFEVNSREFNEVNDESLLVSIINEPDGKIPDNFFIGKVTILIDTIESFSFELIAVGRLDVVQDFPMHLHALYLFERSGIKVLEVILCVSRPLNGKQESVISNLCVEGVVNCKPAEV
jgi:hypothetical protein